MNGWFMIIMNEANRHKVNLRMPKISMIMKQTSLRIVLILITF